MKLKEIEQELLRRRTLKQAKQKQEEKLLKKIKELRKEVRASEKAQAFIQTIAKQTQDNLKVHISEITSLAMSSVFRRPYEVLLDFVPKRGRTEMPVSFRRDGKISNPKFSSGGVKEIVSLGTQISCWSLPVPSKRTRPILIVDELLKWLKGADLPERGARVLQQISKQLGIQIIQVSHSPELIEHSDHVFRVYRRGERSMVEKQ